MRLSRIDIAQAIIDAVDSESHSSSGQSQLIERSRQTAEELGGQAPDEVKALLMALFCRVEIRSDRVDITLSQPSRPPIESCPALSGIVGNTSQRHSEAARNK